MTHPPGDRTASHAHDAPPKKGPMTKSMHDGIAVWCDCCSCEAEPRWVEVAEQMGIEFSNYETPEKPQG